MSREIECPREIHGFGITIFKRYVGVSVRRVEDGVAGGIDALLDDREEILSVLPVVSTNDYEGERGFGAQSIDDALITRPDRPSRDAKEDLVSNDLRGSRSSTRGCFVSGLAPGLSSACCHTLSSPLTGRPFSG
jgi:hypothetical protein